MAKHNAKGRSNGVERFAGLPHDVLNSPGFLATKPNARAVLLELARIYNGQNNGRLGLSIRDAAQRCNIGKSATAEAFQQLEDCGLIDRMTKGSFSAHKRLASEWRLLWRGCDVTGTIPTRRYRQH